MLTISKDTAKIIENRIEFLAKDFALTLQVKLIAPYQQAFWGFI